ncbi:hypothetical protein C8J57DRAFT_1514139 [Mycena rebaudengoi]|nr:hypothetical protein C8J57DRAFT_1514139 [Mycena rebaudengoi]
MSSHHPSTAAAPSSPIQILPQWILAIVSYLFSDKKKRHLIVSIFLTALVISVSFGTTSTLVLQGVDNNISFTGTTSHSLSLIPNFLDVDATARTANIDWFPRAVRCDSPEMVVNLFVDPNLLASTGNGGTASSDPPLTPVFRFNSTEQCSTSIRNSFNVFRTTIKLTGLASPGMLDRESLQAYPYDRYLFQVSMYALLASTNESVGILLEKSFGTPVNFDIKLDKARSSNTEEGILLSFVASRSKAVVGLVIVVVVANWLVTIAFLWITTAAFFWEDKVVTEMVALPIGALFAFTSVRANLPGAPAGFDYYGILPNLVLMTIFGAVLLFRVLQRRIWNAVKHGKPKTQSQKGQYASVPVDTIDQLAAAIEKLKMGVLATENAVTAMATHCRASVQIPANAASAVGGPIGALPSNAAPPSASSPPSPVAAPAIGTTAAPPP